MAADRFSPVAPAYIRVLVLPVGRIERERFVTCLQRLVTEASIVPLGGIVPYAQNEELLLHPQTFPHGSLLYNYTSSTPADQQILLSPFELFREPLLVLGIKDGGDCAHDGDQDDLRMAAEQLRERHPRVVHRQLIVLDAANPESIPKKEGLIHVSTIAERFGVTIRQAALQFSLRFLAELSTYTRAMQASPGIQTPGQTARSLQRNSSVKDHDKRPPSRTNAPQQASVPSSPTRASSETQFNSHLTSHTIPATSFDQLTNVNGQSNRPDSRASMQGRTAPRASSQERVALQGFGSAGSQEKLKSRGKARVGIVLGSIHMLAGQWGEALRLFVEHTSKARLLSDNIWHAKGLEGVVLCLLLNAWSGIDFQIPSICYPVADRSGAANMARFSVNIPSDFRLSSDGQSSPISKLASALPELLIYILKLFNSGEGSLELPLNVVAEVAIRFAKMLAILHNTGGALEQQAFHEIIKGSSTVPLEEEPAAPTVLAGSPFKSTVIDILSTVYPLNDDSLSVADQTGVLSGAASVYAMLQMYRREAMIIKDLIARLTSALVQARKKGAAEIGIHPAASLSVDVGANSVVSSVEESDGLIKLMSEVAATYGVTVQDHNQSETNSTTLRYFGNDHLKLEFMRALAAFCEAAPDPKGTLRLNAAMLRAFGRNVAVDAEPAARAPLLSKDEQARCIAAINRMIGVSKLLGQPTLEAEYWDDFLVRDVEFLPAEPGQAVLDLTAVKSGKSTEGAANGANPLLYDPNASRPGTSTGLQQPSILVQNESAICRITLQNSYDIPMEVESLGLVTDGLVFKTDRQRFTLQPLGIQRVSFSASPLSSGKHQVTGCMVKMQGCRERVFPIISKPWSGIAPTLVKSPHSVSEVVNVPEHVQVAVTVIDRQPTLIVENHPFSEASLMLLDGEVCELDLVIKNTSDIPASVFDVTTTNDAVQLHEIVIEDDSSEASDPTPTTIINPHESVSFTFDIIGKRNVTIVHTMLTYSRHSDSTKEQYARVITVPVSMTVNAALQVQRLDALPLDKAANSECSFVLAFDVGNAWPKSLFYSCFCTDLKLKSAEPRRCHNHEGVLAPGQVQRVFMPIARLETLVPSDLEPETVRQSFFERLRILWELEDEERKGWVDLSGLTMTDQTREVVVGSAISLDLQLLDGETATTAKAGSFVTLRATMHNRATRSVPLIVQLIPHALNSSDEAQMERRIGVAGAQLRFVAPMAQDMEDKVDFVLCPLLVGIVELEVVVKAALEKDEVGPQWLSHEKFTLKVI